jgi:hypothetical protein
MGKYKIIAILILSLAVSPVYVDGMATKQVIYPISALDTGDYSEYEFSINIPTKLFSATPKPDAPDFSADGHWNSAGFTWEEEFQSQLNDLKKRSVEVTFKLVKKSYFVIAGIKNDRVFYHKEFLIVGKDKDIMNNAFLTFAAEYPLKDKEAWDAIMKSCVLSKKKRESK